jgi:hypothetical protein
MAKEQKELSTNFPSSYVFEAAIEAKGDKLNQMWYDMKTYWIDRKKQVNSGMIVFLLCRVASCDPKEIQKWIAEIGNCIRQGLIPVRKPSVWTSNVVADWGWTQNGVDLLHAAWNHDKENFIHLLHAFMMLSCNNPQESLFQKDGTVQWKLEDLKDIPGLTISRTFLCDPTTKNPPEYQIWKARINNHMMKSHPTFAAFFIKCIKSIPRF